MNSLMLLRVIPVLMVISITGCSTMDKLMFWKKDDAKKTDPGVDPALSAENVKSSSVQELELKNAKLWTRVDELEEKVAKQRERLKILERGLMLGILPDELKGPGEESQPVAKNAKRKQAPVKPSHDESAAAVLSDAIEDAEKNPPVSPEKPETAMADESKGKAPSTKAVKETGGAESPDGQEAVSQLNPKEQEEYQRLLASAHDHYRAARYGKAVVEFSELGKVFGGRVDGGMHRYWIARSWIGLKEYQTARQQLSDFLRDYPASPWAPRAKLEMARTEFQLGFKEKALQRLRDVIQTHPYEDAAEMAKMELENFQKAL